MNRCSRCSSDNLTWNDAEYLVCMNCGKILAEPNKKSEITHGIVIWASTVKERLWRIRTNTFDIRGVIS